MAESSSPPSRQGRQAEAPADDTERLGVLIPITMISFILWGEHAPPRVGGWRPANHVSGETRKARATCGAREGACAPRINTRYHLEMVLLCRNHAPKVPTNPTGQNRNRVRNCRGAGLLRPLLPLLCTPGAASLRPYKSAMVSRRYGRRPASR